MNIGTEGASKEGADNEGRRTSMLGGRTTRPEKQGLYDPAYEHDACGVGFVVDIKGRKSHKILQQGLQVADATAFALCMENHLPMIVFGMQPEGNILRVVQGEKIGTLVSVGSAGTTQGQTD